MLVDVVVGIYGCYDWEDCFILECVWFVDFLEWVVVQCMIDCYFEVFCDVLLI